MKVTTPNIANICLNNFFFILPKLLFEESNHRSLSIENNGDNQKGNNANNTHD